jgi:hypothetical protein
MFFLLNGEKANVPRKKPKPHKVWNLIRHEYVGLRGDLLFIRGRFGSEFAMSRAATTTKTKKRTL